MDLLFQAWLHSGAEHWCDEIKKRSVYPEYKPLCFQWNFADNWPIFKKTQYFVVFPIVNFYMVTAVVIGPSIGAVPVIVGHSLLVIH